MSGETHETRSPDETLALGRRFAERLARGDCVALSGPLGAGKTLLVRGVAAGLGLADERLVSSPTFVIVREYPARLPVYHVDLYRLTDAAGELAELGLDEMLADGVVLVEWADRAPEALPARRWEVGITLTGPEARRLSIRAPDGRSRP